MIGKCPCEHCGENIEFATEEFLSGGSVACPHCGKETTLYVGIKPVTKTAVSVPPPPQKFTAPVAPVIPHSEGERVFFQGVEILVTNARFVVGAKTFAVRGITSVEIVKAEQDTDRPGIMCAASRGIAAVVFLAMIGLGLGLWLGDDFSFWVVIGLGTVGFGIWHIVYSASIQRKPVFRILLKTAGGEIMGYQSFDRNHVSQIILALNDSIISNG
jgi:hypothetical protein